MMWCVVGLLAGLVGAVVGQGGGPMDQIWQTVNDACGHRGSPYGRMVSCYKEAHDYFGQNCLTISNPDYEACKRTPSNQALFKGWWGLSDGWHKSIYDCVGQLVASSPRHKRSNWQSHSNGPQQRDQYAHGASMDHGSGGHGGQMDYGSGGHGGQMDYGSGGHGGSMDYGSGGSRGGAPTFSRRQETVRDIREYEQRQQQCLDEVKGRLDSCLRIATDPDPSVGCPPLVQCVQDRSVNRLQELKNDAIAVSQQMIRTCANNRQNNPFL